MDTARLSLFQNYQGNRHHTHIQQVVLLF